MINPRFRVKHLTILVFVVAIGLPPAIWAIKTFLWTYNAFVTGSDDWEAIKFELTHVIAYLTLIGGLILGAVVIVFVSSGKQKR